MKASEVIANLQRRFPNEPEYIQAVSQVSLRRPTSLSAFAFQTALSSSVFHG